MGVDPFTFPVYLSFAVFGILFSVIDIRTHRVPNGPLLAGSGALVCVLLGSAMAHHEWSRLPTAVLAAAALFLFYLLLGVFASGGLGGGDAKFAAPAGLILGLTGWETVIVATVAACVMVAIGALLTLVWSRQQGRATASIELPFVPFICGGAWIAIFWGEPILMLLGFE